MKKKTLCRKVFILCVFPVYLTLQYNADRARGRGKFLGKDDMLQVHFGHLHELLINVPHTHLGCIPFDAVCVVVVVSSVSDPYSIESGSQFGSSQKSQSGSGS